MLGLDRNSVKVCPYEENWAKEYQKEEKFLKEILKDYNFQIEHVGSTAIKGLSSKPIIDIVIGVDNLEILMKFGEILDKHGYDNLNSIETKGEILARKGPETCRTHYIHMTTIGSDYWNELIYFKKYLLEHPNLIEEYENLKKELSIKYPNDRKKYTSAKNDFISNILKKAYELYNVNEI